jgi:hypothetical protein
LNAFQAIDARRRELKLSISGLCRRANVPVTTYWRVATGRKKQWYPGTLKKFERALAVREPAPKPPADDKAIGDLYRAYVVILAGEMGQDPERVLRSNPRWRLNTSSQWRDAAYVRALAVYCVTIQLDLSAARVGRAIGLTRAAVSQINRRVEDFRDDPKIDALVERIGQLVSGRE